MWLNIAHSTCANTADQAAADELFNRAMSLATPEDRAQAVAMAAGETQAARF